MIEVILGLYWGYIRVILGLHRIMEKKMETTRNGHYSRDCASSGSVMGSSLSNYCSQAWDNWRIVLWASYTAVPKGVLPNIEEKWLTNCPASQIPGTRVECQLMGKGLPVSAALIVGVGPWESWAPDKTLRIRNQP